MGITVGPSEEAVRISPLEAWGYRLKFEKFRPVYGLVGILRRDDALLLAGRWSPTGSGLGGSEKWSQPSIDFEHKIAEICHRVGREGWTFDSHKAGELYAQLSIEKATIEDELQELFPPWTVEEEFIPKVNNARLVRQGEPFIKKKEITFNPNSRKHIQYCLQQKYDWQPVDYTASGDAKIDETTLGVLRIKAKKAGQVIHAAKTHRPAR